VGAWDPALDLLAPGYTIACIGSDERLVRIVAERTGRSGIVVWCRPTIQPPLDALPANCAVVRCDAAFLPVLSHALDAALLELERVDEAALAEVRRALAPGGTLVARNPNSAGRSAQLRSTLSELGFRLPPDASLQLLVGLAPG
jgi:hypothetical protein